MAQSDLSASYAKWDEFVVRAAAVGGGRGRQ